MLFNLHNNYRFQIHYTHVKKGLHICQMAKYQHFKSCCSSPNIAIVKYWGKSDERNILPLNSSVSVTLSSDDIRTRSSLYEVSNCNKSSLSLVLNGTKSEVGPRLQNIMQVLRTRTTKEERKTKSLLIVSQNDFPTASGMASSASGFAAIAFLLCSFFELNSDWSVIARLGSGSACRSMHGGFVLWEKGTCSEDSRAVQLSAESHWPELRILVLVFSSSQKNNPSTGGMQRSVETSQLLKHRLEIVSNRIAELKQAIQNKDFEKFGLISMKESNQLHAICLDSLPPISYLNTQSFELIGTIHAFNDSYGRLLACYSFDAGSNAFIFFEEKTKTKLYSWLLHVFPQCNLTLDERDEPDSTAAMLGIPVCSLDATAIIPHFETRVGRGPMELLTPIPVGEL